MSLKVKISPYVREKSHKNLVPKETPPSNLLTVWNAGSCYFQMRVRCSTIDINNGDHWYIT